MGLSLNRPGIAKKPPLPAPRIIPKATAEFEQVVKEETREADRVIAESDAVLDKTPAESPIVVSEQNISGEEDKLNRLIDDDFPFDDTQLTAIYGLAQQQYGVMIGAAGTGKTTTTKKLVDILRDGLDEIDVSKYWQRGEAKEGDAEYEIPERLIPNIVMCSFTGRATQMIKKNFPRDWHGNIMTIHRMLGFYPEFYEDFDPESGGMVNKRRFVPAYTAENLMPWRIIIVDEAGMLGLELWHQLLAATHPDCRIIFIGDINQLPPTHGKSILGFALANWPTWELTHVHRQQGENNSIVDNAHRILKGLRPITDSPEPLSLKTPEQMIKALNFMASDADWRFITVEVPEDHRQASQRIRQCMQLLQGKLYEPNRDVVITPINGYEQTAPGYTLGQAPMNQELVVKLNSKNPRYIIDAGREKQNFAVGDKVMATVNDYEAGITNGMTGVVTDITENGGYIGDTRRWGLITEVNEYLSGLVTDEDDDIEFSLEEMVNDSQAGLEESRKKEKRDAGPASHIIEVEFGEGEHAFKIAFSTKSTVSSLMLAYVATCHKMQGGECPHVFGIVHQANKRPLNREWFYTMVTRAAQKCVVFTTRQGLGFALGKQNIKGATLEAKVKTFIALTASGLVGPSVRVKLPKRRGLGTELTPYEPKEIVSAESKAEIQASAQPAGQSGSLPATRIHEGRQAVAESNPQSNAPVQSNEPSRREESQKATLDESPMAPSIKVGSLHIHIHESQPTPIRTGTGRDTVDDGHRVKPIDGGILHGDARSDNQRSASRVEIDSEKRTRLEPSATVALPKPESREVIPIGPVYTLAQARRPGPPLLTHNPFTVNEERELVERINATPNLQPNPKSSKPLSIGALLARGKIK